MGSFRFKFQSVLDHRRSVEDQRQRELAQHMRKRMILRDQLEQMQQTIRDSKHELSDALTGKVDMERIAGFSRFAGHTAQRARVLAQHIGEAEKKIADARQRLLDATRQRRAMELLRDRHYEQWRRERRRAEDRELDELATQAHVRTLAAGGSP